MSTMERTWLGDPVRACGALVLAACSAGAAAAASARRKTTFKIYGFAMLDMGYQAEQNDPDWFDVLRPTKLPRVRT